MTAEKPKTKRRYWSLFVWQVEEMESWLAAMAAKGWHLSHTNGLFAVFVQGEPQTVRYRCEYFNYRGNELYHRVELYEAAGWEYVASRNNVVHIFRAQAEDSVPEIHTDSLESVQSARVLERLLSGCQGGMGAVGAVLVIRFFQTPHFNLVSVLLTNSVLSWLIIPCWFFGLFFTLWHVIHSIRAVVRVRKGALLRNKSYRPARLVNASARAVILVLLLAVPLEILTFKTFSPFPSHRTTEDYPRVVRISDLMPGKELELLRTAYRSNSSALVPQQWRFTDHVRVADEQWPGGANYEPSMHLDGYKARTEWLAGLLGKVLARERASDKYDYWINLRKLEVDNSSLDSLWYYPHWLDQEFIAVQGRWVFHVQYDGVESIEDLFTVVGETIDALEQGEGGE